MSRTDPTCAPAHRTRPPLAAAAFAALLFLPACTALASDDRAAAAGHVRGRVVAAAAAEAISFADVLLIPADTTLRRVGGMTNSDGTFLLEAAPGAYTLQVRAISYARKQVTGVIVEAGELRELAVTLEPEAIVQPAVEVQAEARKSSEAALLAERRRAATVGDALSAELVRRTPDRDAGEALRRVTGLSVLQGRYVFVRGLGERYSSTEVDGVRVVSPEQNKRVVPLDLFPADLLDHVIVQKTYSVDRPGEFGGGDVQVRTRDFPGRRSFSFRVGQGYDEGTTFSSFMTDRLGLGLSERATPSVIQDVAGGKPVFPRGLDPSRGFSRDTMAAIGRSFRNAWSPITRNAPLSQSLVQTYGDEFRVFGRPLGIVEAATYGRSFNTLSEKERFFTSAGDTVYDYAVTRSSETARLSGLLGVSLRLAPNHSLHVRSLFTRDDESEARSYLGSNSSLLTLVRSNRLLYVERSLLTSSLEGRHELRGWVKPRLEWRAGLSRATRREPDRRESIYQQVNYRDDNDSLHTIWTMSGGGLGATRYFGDMTDHGRGFDARLVLPFARDRASAGRLELGGRYDRRDRESTYRRFNFKPGSGVDLSAPPESLFQEGRWSTAPGGPEVVEATRSDDNYSARQRQGAGFASLDLPLPLGARAVLGLRVERGEQDVRTYDLFTPSRVVAHARLDDTDLLPAANLTLPLGRDGNLRLAASRTVSRPDLRELSPGPTLEFLNGLRVRGNADLRRATIENYDARAERFPSAVEVLALGGFVKRFHDPIEQVIRPGDAPYLQPENSESARLMGAELEARISLGRLAARLRGLSLNSNLTLAASRVTLGARATTLGSQQHPLQGQSNVLWNGALTWTRRDARADLSLLANTVGRHLEALGVTPRPDRYEQTRTALDAAFNWSPRPFLRVKVAGKNLTDAPVRVLEGGKEARSYRRGRAFSVGVAWTR